MQYFQKRGQLKIQSPSSLNDYFSYPSLGQIFNIKHILKYNTLNLWKELFLYRSEL